MEEVVEVKVNIVKKKCEECKKGYMEYFVDKHNPLDLTHKCNSCGKIEILSKLYPYIQFINRETGEIEKGML